MISSGSLLTILFIQHMCTILNIRQSIQRMELVQTSSFSLTQRALFPHSALPLLAVHPSARYFSFQTRKHQLILADTTTGHFTTLYSSHHPFQTILFANQYLLATHQTSHQVLVFSLKAGKLKTRLSGHRAEINHLAYCRQTELIASISHDLCLLYHQKSLTHLKTIKCSSSSFVDCCFGLLGGFFATSFKDGSILLWDPQTWTHRNSAVIASSPSLTTGDGTVLAVYTSHKLWLCDTTQTVPNYQQLLSFWQGNIKQVLFINHLLIINTTSGLFLAELNLDHSFKIIQARKLTQTPASLAHTHYQSTLVTLSSDSKTVSILSINIHNTAIIKKTNNPLTNQGLVCAGGYSNTQGCIINNALNTANQYQHQQMQIEPLTEGCYLQIPSTMDLPKLKAFIKKHFFLPDKYRPIAYRFALHLPVSPSQFRQLESKGPHPSTQLLSVNYPIPNQTLAQTMKQMMNLLAHWSGIMGESDLVPPIVFPFVCLFGNDTFLCFQVLYRLFTGPLSFLFTEFPLANSKILQNLWQILKNQDPQLTNHLEQYKISFTRLAWSLIGTFFTLALSRQSFLAIADLVLIRVDQPEMVLFVCLGYLVFNRKRILSADNEATASLICESQQTLHLGKFLAVVHKIHHKYSKKIRYPLNVSLQTGSYQEIDVPSDALKMQQNRRNVLVQEVQKQKQNQAQRQKMLLQMESMIVRARREAERQSLESQAYKLHCQQQQNLTLKIKPIDRTIRLQRLQSLMSELTKALQKQKNGRQILKQYVPAVQILQKNSDSQLDDLQLKLMKLLSQVRPATSLKPLISQPINFIKSGEKTTGLEGAVGARLANQLWEMDELSNQNHKVKWQNGILTSIKH